MPAGALALFVIIAAAVALFVIEAYYAAHHKPTISEDVQRFNFSLGGQLLAGIYFVLGALAGWFVAHFNDVPH
jgi:multisubunit Na+/H+ antiporter MnhB subunit